MLAGLGVGAFLLVRATTADPAGTVPADFRPVTAAGLTWSVPPDWTPAPGSGGTVSGATLEGVHNGAPYECGGSSYLRGFTAVALVGAGVPLGAAAEQFAQEAGANFYRPADDVPPEVRTTPPRPVDAGGAPAQLVEATVRASDDGCLATEGVLLVLAVETAAGTAVLVVNGDTAGGPPSAPPVPDRATLDAMIASARPAGGI
ncbi:MAG: hypothetical protein NTW05_22800 [Pseudonocardiales bacterium]|nr:hypothetical protein [Pseudonocardiales bacterium]